MQTTLILLKPDTVQRSLIGRVIARLEDKHFQIVGMKMMQLTNDILDDHYADLTDKPFYPEIVNYMTNGPVVAIALKGENVVVEVRKMCGATDPADAAMGTIRGDFAKTISHNIIHASDSEETAKAELNRFFSESELSQYDRNLV